MDAQQCFRGEGSVQAHGAEAQHPGGHLWDAGTGPSRPRVAPFLLVLTWLDQSLAWPAPGPPSSLPRALETGRSRQLAHCGLGLG